MVPLLMMILLSPLLAALCLPTQFILGVIQQFTLFSVVAMSVYGRTFCASSRKISGTLRRNVMTVFNFCECPRTAGCPALRCQCCTHLRWRRGLQDCNSVHQGPACVGGFYTALHWLLQLTETGRISPPGVRG